MSKNTTLILSIAALGAAYMLNNAAKRKIMKLREHARQQEIYQANRRHQEATRQQTMQQMRAFEDILGADLCDQIRNHVQDAQRGMGM